MPIVNANSYSYRNTDRDSYSYGDTNFDSTTTDTYAYSNTNSYCYSNSDTDANSKPIWECMPAANDGESYSCSQHAVQFHGTSKRH